MMNAGDIPFLAIAIAIAVLVTALTFFALRKLKAPSTSLRLGSALAFPALLIAIIVYVNVWNPDPHGYIMVGLGFLSFMSLPFTILTTAILARRFG
jgi:hypothetical protein